jgi:hypothetical protein
LRSHELSLVIEIPNVWPPDARRAGRRGEQWIVRGNGRRRPTLGNDRSAIIKGGTD